MLSTLSVFLGIVIFLEILFLTSKTRQRESNIEIDERKELFAGETYDYSGEYRIVRFYKTDERNFGSDWDWNDLTLVSQGTVNALAGLPRLLENFSGLISFSVFCPGTDASVASAAMQKLQECDENVRKRVTFNLVYPAEQPAEVSVLEDAFSCDNLENFLKNYRITQMQSGPIPWNILRNVGRSTTHSEFFLELDADMMPSKDLRFNFNRFANDKNLWDENDKIIYILDEVPRENDSFVQDEEIDSSLMKTYGTENIPIFVARRNIPFYDERFKTRRFDRTQLFCELYTAGYSFKRISSHIEKGISLKMNEETDEMEWLLFNYHFKDELPEKYSTNKTCPWISTSSRSKAHNSDFLRYRIQQNEMGEPVATKNEPPFYSADSSSLTNTLLPSHDHKNKKLHLEGVAHYSLNEMQELYEKGLSSEELQEFRAPNDDDLTWELD